MKDRLNHNLNQTFTSKSGIIKVSDADIQASAHIQLWLKTHPDLIDYDHDFLPKHINICAMEKDLSYQCGFNRALELISNGVIDINNVTINNSLDPDYASTGIILDYKKI